MRDRPDDGTARPGSAGRSGSTLSERVSLPTEVPRSCPFCDAPVEFSYKTGFAYYTCTECAGLVPPQLADDLPTGTLMRSDTRPATVANRNPEEAFVATTVDLFRRFGLIARGNCPECSGRSESSVHRCESHDPPSDGVCEDCGTQDEVRARFVCSVCKWWKFGPVESAVVDHPAVVAFCHDHDLPSTYDIDGAEACARLWEHKNERDHALISEDPLRVRVSVPGDGETLFITLDGNLDVVDVTRR